MNFNSAHPARFGQARRHHRLIPDIKPHSRHCPVGGFRINSGGPPNKSAKFHFDSFGHCFGGGISFGSPFGTPASTHFTIVSICASGSERSFLNFWMPTVLSICHGGIWRVITRSRIALAQGRTSSYVTSDIGAIESGLWHDWHFSCNMGAMSLVKVIVVFADSALKNCGDASKTTSAGALSNLEIAIALPPEV